MSVFSGGGEYKIFRIPALCRAAKALLAFAEARPTIEDNGSIDLVMRRSTDGGRTWSALKRVVWGDLLAKVAGIVGSVTVSNPVPLFLPPTPRHPEGRLLLMFCSNAGSVNEDAIRADATVAADAGRRVWLLRSDDGGAAWSAAREVTSEVKRPGWTWYATGPGGGLVLRNGTLVVAATHAVRGTNEDHSHLLSSHDGGESWLVSADAARGTNEGCVAQLADGPRGLRQHGRAGHRQHPVADAHSLLVRRVRVGNLEVRKRAGVHRGRRGPIIHRQGLVR